MGTPIFNRAIPRRFLGVQRTLQWVRPLSLRTCPHSTKCLPRNAHQPPRRPHLNPAQRLGLSRFASSESSVLRRTPLHDLHVAHNGKMVPFAGYSMPVQYEDLSVGDSHRWTREKASLFDVGHMVQHRLGGPGANGLLLRVTPASLVALQPHQSTLSCLLHPGTGGIVDDTVITRLGPELFYVVTNAACRDKDLAYLTENIAEVKAAGGGAIDWEVLDGWGLVALQGPLSAEILEGVLAEPLVANLRELYFGHSCFVTVRLSSGETADNVLVSRGGYTGEDGFEISLPPAVAAPFTETLLRSGGPNKLRLAGLGARDSLRLEAGMCLYGHDLDDITTPVEAGLGWTVGKDRRTDGSFHGADVVLRQLKPVKDGGSGVSRRRVGLVVDGAPAREGAEIVDAEGSPVGKVTSGCPSPSLGANIAMGYVKNGLHKAGTEVGVVVRGRKRKATVAKMPFVPSRYWRPAVSPA